MTPQLVFNVLKLSSSSLSEVYQSAYLTKEDFTQVA